MFGLLIHDKNKVLISEANICTDITYLEGMFAGVGINVYFCSTYNKDTKNWTNFNYV